MQKNNRTLLIIFVVLLVAYVLIRMQNSVEKLKTFCDADSSAIARIVIENKQSKIILEKEKAQWMVTYPGRWDINPERLKDLFSKVLSAKTTRIPVSQNVKNQDQYMVSAPRGIKFTLIDSKNHVLDSYYVGYSRNSGYSFARKIDSNDIYQLKDNIADYIMPDPNQWRTPVILEMPMTAIIRIDVSYPLNKYSLYGEGADWYFQDKTTKFKLSPTNRAVGKVFNGLAYMQTSSFIDHQWDKLGMYFEKPEAVVTITDVKGSKVQFTFCMTPNNRVYLQRNHETETLYEMNTDFLDRFTISPTHFKD